MNTSLMLAKTALLDPGSLDEQHIQRVLNSLLTHEIDSADLYFQLSHHEAWTLEDGIVKDAGYSIDKGVGVRAIAGEKTGFAYSDDVIFPALQQAANASRSIARSGQSGQLQAWHRGVAPQALYLPDNPLHSLPEQEKIALLQQLDVVTRALSPYVSQVIISLSGSHDTILVAASDGTLAGDVRPLVRLDIQVIVERNGRREVGSAGCGGRTSYQHFFSDNRAQELAQEAVRQALVNLDAIPAPAGTMPVVLGPGWPGVLLHEAIGHGLEGDFNRRGTSAFSGRIGEQVASPLCTIVDDGTLAGRRGSLTIDDEGTPSACTVLIEKGILKGYLQDKHNARLMGMQPTGNGRRESYSQLVLPRMTNTYMLAGTHDPQDIIKSVKKGIYAVNFGGGQVDITSGKFVFSANEAYLIEDGKITAPVKGATLIGNGPDVLTRVSMVGHDLALDKGVGVCGKEGQSVPVGVGQPTLKIDELTVGGTQQS